MTTHKHNPNQLHFTFTNTQGHNTMNDSVIFSEILDIAPSDVKPPPTLPAGAYLCTVQGLPRFDKSSQKGTPFVEYTLVILAPGEDITDSKLAEVEGGVEGKTLKATYYLTPDSQFRLKEFFEHCGLDVKNAKSMRELVEQPVGCQVIAYIKHEPAKDGSNRVFARISNTAPVKD